MSSRGRSKSIASVLLLGCAVAGVALVVHWVDHRGEGPRHIYPLRGNEVLSDEQATALAKQTLQLDERYSEKMEPVMFGGDRVVGRGEDKSFVSLGWRDPGTYKEWFVQLHRTPERVEAVSYPGE